MSTIVALSTPTGRGALAVIRLSGPTSTQIAKHLIGSDVVFSPRRATLQKIRYPQTEEILDQVVVTAFIAPHSMTGEDVVEISCHGSPAIVRQIIDLSLTLGARLAGPGEFTLRALSNGRINLAQAEAIRDLIAAQTELAARQAARQVNGELSIELVPLKQQLVEIIVVLESALEFVEDDLPDVQTAGIRQNLSKVMEGVTRLADTYRAGRLIQDGIKVTILGSPNVGKSSLFNGLVERDRAIVTDKAGTTRDTLSESIEFDGIPVVLTDTAGLRETDDAIENLGIERTQRAMADADVLIVVLDSTAELGPDDRELLSQTAGTRRVIVSNKCDLSGFNGNGRDPECVSLSALTGEGLETLRIAILNSLNGANLESSGLLVTNARHHDLLTRAASELRDAIDSLKQRQSEELILVPLHNALRYLGQITGETTTEDILSEIFSTFCIGK
jgi:tRNA modification GTPase